MRQTGVAQHLRPPQVVVVAGVEGPRAHDAQQLAAQPYIARRRGPLLVQQLAARAVHIARRARAGRLRRWPQLERQRRQFADRLVPARPA